MTTHEASERLKQLDNVLILTHVRPDGDTVGGASALCQALRERGKTAYLLPNDGITDTYGKYAAPYWASSDFTPQSVVAVDIATVGLFPDNAKPYAERVALCIDHHPSNELYAAATCLDANAAAACEVIYAIVRELTPLTPEIALPLYVGLSADCGCFQYANTTPRTHRIAAELMEVVDVSAVNHDLYRVKGRVRMLLESRMVQEMELYDGGRVVVMQVPLRLREEFHATDADIEALSSLAAQVEGTDCGITLRELATGGVKISLRTGPRVDACAVCQKFGGGGHRAASGATVSGSLDEVKKQVLAAVAEVVQTKSEK